MKYINLDIKTTSNNVDSKILQLCAGAVDSEYGVISYFKEDVHYKEIDGSPLNLASNSDLLNNMAYNYNPNLTIINIYNNFLSWVIDINNKYEFLNGTGDTKNPFKLIIGGKNPSSFIIPVFYNNLKKVNNTGEILTNNSSFILDNNNICYFSDDKLYNFEFSFVMDVFSMCLASSDNNSISIEQCADRLGGSGNYETGNDIIDNIELTSNIINYKLKQNDI